MRAVFNPVLVNGPFGDSGVYAESTLEKRALLFDVGELAGLAPRQILRITDVFVSHTHMDHFMGFDHLVRLGIGNRGGVRLFGPPRFVAQVGHKPAGYTWKLVENYPQDYVIEAWELEPTGAACGARYHAHARFAALAREADPLFTECVFPDADREHAARKKHLTARQAGSIARRAGARSIVPFHFSPRYGDRGDELASELERAWRDEEARSHER